MGNRRHPQSTGGRVRMGAKVKGEDNGQGEGKGRDFKRVGKEPPPMSPRDPSDR